MKESIDRRRFLWLAGAGTAAAAFPFWGCKGKNKKAKQPNIILIMADDLGYEGLSCYGSASYQTPFLDELARTGARFVHAYSQPLCTPSRVQIMTGRYNHRNYSVFGILDPQERTFGHMLKQAGYATCVVGKWQLYTSDALREQDIWGTLPEDAGFDDYCLWHLKTRESRYADPIIEVKGQPSRVFTDQYGPDIFVDYMDGFMEKHRSEPFFVYFPMALTHSPFVPTPDSAGWQGDRHKSDNKYFADMIAHMDKLIGRIVQKVDALGLRENTLILFTTDNGTHRNITSRMNDGTEIKGGKGFPADAGTRVPLIANWTGTIPEGLVLDDLIDFSDFLPTLAEVSGARLPDVTIDGRSFAPQLRGGKGNPREWIYCYYAGREVLNVPPTQFARDKRWKLYDDGRLFDIDSDVLEQHQVPVGSSDAHAQVARKKLEAVLDSMRQ